MTGKEDVWTTITAVAFPRFAMHSAPNRTTVPITHSFQSNDGYTKLIETYSHHRSLQPGRVLHGRLIIAGLARLTHFASKLIAFYTECGQLSHARQLFDDIPQINMSRWIVLIGAYARHGFFQEAMGVFCGMQREGIRPNKFVLPSVLKACGHLSYRRTGETIHAMILRNEFECDEFVNATLIDMYSKCGRIGKAGLVFDGMVEKDLVALNALTSGFVQHGLIKEALGLVDKMKFVGLQPNVVTWNTLIAGFSQASDESTVTELFQLMNDAGVEPDVVSWTSVISGRRIFIFNAQYADNLLLSSTLKFSSVIGKEVNYSHKNSSI
ncbi:hypothetical protein RJ639_016047 [Escallonia herrerae]|uniref:Pentatricopeptide repeat-containing protein n=1 Tax=Escallonia herrerae TaxID=1293975 RepID=A0AA88VEI1_9ASTE|nr:hypothetical protein RJ639_016047 [Escallonia herrerae]